MVIVACTLLVLYLGYLLLEAALHRRNRRAVAIRIHVNGTRGKSSVTRLIAAGLRAGGVATVAKTTGTLPRLIDLTGAEEPIRRMGPANLIEQAEVFAWARRQRAQAIVIECVAVQPVLQAVAEERFVQSTIGVITNTRPDHLDVMGPTVADVAHALSNTVPTGGVLFTAESEPDNRGTLAARCARRHTHFVAVQPSSDPTEQAAMLDGFRYVEHPDNVALALAVCAHLGVPEAVALRGMWAATPDPGALTIRTVETGDRRLRFINALAANDPASTLAIWQRVFAAEPAHPNGVGGDRERRVVLVNTRRDRQHRSLQLAELLPHLPADAFVVTGGGREVALRRAVELGIPTEQIRSMGDTSVDSMLNLLWSEARPAAVIFAIGNVGGIGLALVARLEESRHGL